MYQIQLQSLMAANYLQSIRLNNGANQSQSNSQPNAQQLAAAAAAAAAANGQQLPVGNLLSSYLNLNAADQLQQFINPAAFNFLNATNAAAAAAAAFKFQPPTSTPTKHASSTDHNNNDDSAQQQQSPTTKNSSPSAKKLNTSNTKTNKSIDHDEDYNTNSYLNDKLLNKNKLIKNK